MRLLLRLHLVALAACVALAIPALADEPRDPPPEEPKPCEEPCEGEPPRENGTAPEEPAPPAAPQYAEPPVPVQTTCDLVRATGGRPQVSVNPVLGLVTVDPSCVSRWIQSPHRAVEFQMRPII